MPRILHVIDDLGPGGTQTQLRLLAGASAARGDEVQIAVGRYPGDSMPPFTAAGASVAWIGRRFAYDPFAVRKLIATAGRFKPDLMQSWGAASARLCQAARRWLTIPWVHTVRQRCQERRWRADGLIFAHESLEDGPSAQVTSVVPNAIDPSLGLASVADKQAARKRLRDAGVDLSDDSPTIVAAMRMDRATAAKEIAWAADLVRVVRPGLRLLVAGDGPGRMAAERFAARACEPGTVVWLGEWADLGTAYAAADVVWCGAGTSPTPTPALEGMAAGKPVVVAEAPGREALAGALRLPWNDRAAWAKTTKRLFAEPEVAAQMGRENAEFVRQSHGLPVVTQAYREALDRALPAKVTA